MNRRTRVDEEAGASEGSDEEEAVLRAAEASYELWRSGVVVCCVVSACAIGWCAWRLAS